MSDNMNAPLLPSSQNNKQMPWQTPNHKMVETKAIIYQSDAMNQLMKIIDRVAPSGANVLIMGESGTGKELIAHAIHNDLAQAFTNPDLGLFFDQGL